MVINPKLQSLYPPFGNDYLKFLSVYPSSTWLVLTLHNALRMANVRTASPQNISGLSLPHFGDTGIGLENLIQKVGTSNAKDVQVHEEIDLQLSFEISSMSRRSHLIRFGIFLVFEMLFITPAIVCGHRHLALPEFFARARQRAL